MYSQRYRERIFAPGELVRHLVNGLVERGHEVVWFSAPGEKTKARLVSGDKNLLDKDLEIRVFQDLSETIKSKMSLYATKMYYEMDLLTRAFAAAQRGEVDLLHVFHSFGYLAHFFAELTQTPTVFTLHDPLPTDDMLENWLMNRFSGPRYISISRSQQGDRQEHFIGNVYNGINEKEFAFAPQGGERLIAVGRLIPEKGFEQSILAAKMAGEKLTIATWLTDNVKNSDYYQQKIAPHVDGDKISVASLFLGEKRVKLYQDAKALLLPLVWEEPFGLVMTEAMSCGTPVIAYNRGSVAEVVKDGVAGFIVDPDGGMGGSEDRGKWIIKKRGVEGLVEAIKRIGEIDRAACRAHVEQNFTVDKMVESYEKIYQKALAK